MDISKQYLFRRHRNAGMALNDDEDSVTLTGKGGVIARWLPKVTIEEIRREADLALGIIFYSNEEGK